MALWALLSIKVWPQFVMHIFTGGWEIGIPDLQSLILTQRLTENHRNVSANFISFCPMFSAVHKCDRRIDRETDRRRDDDNCRNRRQR